MALIVIQAGHYPRKTGATGTGGLDGDPTEQEFNIAAAQACATEIAKIGHQARVIWADVPNDHYRGAGFVAIHCDGSLNRTARGASVGYRNNAGHDFAQAWKQAYYNEGWRGFRPDNYTLALSGYYGTRRALEAGNPRAFIAEAGFLTNPQDEAMLSLPGGPLRFARSIAKAVQAVFGVVNTGPSVAELIQEEDEMFLYSAPNEPVFFCDGGVSVGINEPTDMDTFLTQKVKHFKLDDDTFKKFRARFPGA